MRKWMLWSVGAMVATLVAVWWLSRAPGGSRGLDFLRSGGRTGLKQATEQQITQAGPARLPSVAEINPTGARASFLVRVKQVVVPYEVMGLFVLPGETVEFQAIYTSAEGDYLFLAYQGPVEAVGENIWSWTAPDAPGMYPAVVQGPIDRIRFNIFVQNRFVNGQQVFRGYRVGRYESKPLRGNPRFNVPRGLIEVNNRTAPERVSPSLTLGDFASHQPGTPRYLALDERLILKLEAIREVVIAEGIELTSFTIMSGFRTPWYNASIGNTTRYSLHLYGRAADIFIDEDGNGRMDDLNGNGREDVGDARVLYNLIDGLKDQAWYQPFLGGLGLYGPASHRGAFVHVDTRGETARW